LTTFSYGGIRAVLMKVFQYLNLFFFKCYISHNEINIQILLHIKNKIRHYFILNTYALEEVVIRPFNLTGYLEIDTKLIPEKENYRYSISGLTEGYEAGEYSPNAFGKVMGSIFNPADMLYNFFGKKPKELKRLKEMKKDDTVRNLLETKFDRETISVLLGVDKKEIAEILERCNYSESFVKTANDLQIWTLSVLAMKNIKS
jgi:hypothetical protein